MFFGAHLVYVEYACGVDGPGGFHKFKNFLLSFGNLEFSCDLYHFKYSDHRHDFFKLASINFFQLQKKVSPRWRHECRSELEIF
jgi:hypothetical protein